MLAKVRVSNVKQNKSRLGGYTNLVISKNFPREPNMSPQIAIP